MAISWRDPRLPRHRPGLAAAVYAGRRPRHRGRRPDDPRLRGPREYGVPAVVGVDRATQRLHTGQIVLLPDLLHDQVAAHQQDGNPHDSR